MLRGGGENAELLGILILFGGGTLIRAQHYIYIYLFIYLYLLHIWKMTFLGEINLIYITHEW